MLTLRVYHEKILHDFMQKKIREYDELKEIKNIKRDFDE